MYAQKEKQKENKSRAVANSVAQKKSSMKQGFGIVDNQPEGIAQRKLQGMANTSFQVKHTTPLQAEADQNVMQLQTKLTYTNDPSSKKGTSTIATVNHNRSSVNGAARTAAANGGQWSTIPGGAVANHSRPYTEIEADIEAYLQGNTLSTAANNLDAIYAPLNYTPLPGPHAGTMASLVGGTQSVAIPDIENAFDYYIARIADYPNNLFFWPDQTGANPDEPLTDYGTGVAPVPGGWVYNPFATAADAALGRPNPPIVTERARLGVGRTALTNAGV